MMFFICVGVLMLVAFVVMLIGLWGIMRSLQVKWWLTTRGTIDSCHIHSWQYEGSEYHEVRVEYTYMVRGKQYTSKRIAFGYDGSVNLETQEQILNKLLSANQVDVRYHPTKPQIASLTYGIHNTLRRRVIYATIGLIFCFGFLGAGLAILYSEKIFPQQF